MSQAKIRVSWHCHNYCRGYQIINNPAITCVPKRLGLVAQMLKKPHGELNQMKRIRELGIRLGSIALGVQPVSV